MQVQDAAVIHMVEPLLGFPDDADFALVRLDDGGLVCSLVSGRDEQVRFLVVAPPLFFPDYAPEIDDQTVELLAPESPDDLLVFVLVTATPSGDTTANLLAPIVVNHRTMRAVQVLLSDDLPLRAPVSLG